MRRVMYLYLPDWPIDRLRRLHQARNGSPASAAPADEPPFATVAAAGGRRLLAAVNPAAAAAGLAPGMALADALSFLPGLATAAAEPTADQAALARLAEWCARYSPWTAPDFQSGGGSDGIRIEITGCAHLWGGEDRLAADLARRLTRQGITHRIAAAGTLSAAWALARFAAAPGRPALAPAGAERAALAPLPVEALRLDPATAAGLRRVGLRQVGALYPMPRAALAHRFGASLARRLDQALGEEPEPLSPVGEAPARRVRLGFAEPIADPADLARAARRLAEDVAVRLLREGLGARRLDLAFHRLDGRVEHIAVGTARPSRDAGHLADLFLARLETVDPGPGIEDMILVVFAAERLAAEQTAFVGGGGAMTDGTAPLLDRLGARLGLAALGQLAARQSHIPERASVYVPISTNVVPGRAAGANPEPMNTGRGNVDSGFGTKRRPGMTRKESPTKPPRPVRLFLPPEPIAAAWLLPDDPPFRFTWRRRRYRVCRADGPERIAAEWWTAEAAASGEAVRDYYRVEDEAGRHFWLFRAGLPGVDEKGAAARWFLHGVFA